MNCGLANVLRCDQTCFHSDVFHQRPHLIGTTGSLPSSLPLSRAVVTRYPWALQPWWRAYFYARNAVEDRRRVAFASGSHRSSEEEERRRPSRKRSGARRRASSPQLSAVAGSVGRCPRGKGGRRARSQRFRRNVGPLGQQIARVCDEGSRRAPTTALVYILMISFKVVRVGFRPLHLAKTVAQASDIRGSHTFRH